MEDSRWPPLVRQAAALMQREYAHYAGVEELAARLGVTREHLVRTFSAAVGEPPGRYLTRVRLENACRYLAGRAYPVELIAGLCGFSCGNYFDKVFRRAYGISPLAYRALHCDENTPPPEGEGAMFV